MVKKLIYKAHVIYMGRLDRIDVKRRLVTFSDNPEML
jgi:hypothetical protein